MPTKKLLLDYLRKVKNHKKQIILFVLFVSSLVFFQSILARKHLEFGFFIDDWIFLAEYGRTVTNPLLDAVSAWKDLRSHTFAHAYYVGILHEFFGLNYKLYHYLNESLKILAGLSLFPLIYYIFRSKLMAALATFIYTIHFSPFGTLDNVSRGEDFIAIILMNFFLLAYIFIVKNNLAQIKLILLMSLFLFITLFIDPTRMFPMVILIPLFELFMFLYMKEKFILKQAVKRLGFLFLPFLVLYLIAPDSINSQLSYYIGLRDRLLQGNFQLFLGPLASFGSMFVPPVVSTLFNKYLSTINFSTFFVNFLLGPFLIFITLTSVFGAVVSKNLFKFIRTALLLYIPLPVIAFFAANKWYQMDSVSRAAVDPGVFFAQAIFGILVFSFALTCFLHRNSFRENKIFPIAIFGSVIFALIFIFLTWIWADINSIFTGVHAYLNIPSIGFSIFASIIIYLVYKRFRKFGLLFGFLTLILIFSLSFIETDKYFSKWLKDGLSAREQNQILDKFWDEVGYEKHFSTVNPEKYQPLFYLDTSEDYPNGAFYDHTITHKVVWWLYARKGEERSGRFSYCDTLVLTEKDLKMKVKEINGKKGLYSNCHKEFKYDLDNFYAFKLKDRDITSIKEEVIKKLGLEQ